MKSLSLKLDQDIYDTAQKFVKELGLSRNRYINQAVKEYNKQNYRRWLEEQFKKASLECREESMKTLKEFESIDNEPLDKIEPLT